MSYLDRVRGELEAIAALQQRRSVRGVLAVDTADFSSNDYLGLSRDPRVVAAVRSADRVGSGGSRLLGGAQSEHAQLETALAQWTGREAARLFSSGYLAAIGAVAALAPCVDVAYSDALVHACIIDGLRLTKLERHIVAHGGIPQRGADERPAMIVSESLFGMDAAPAPLAALLDALRAGDVLLIDEAHALGVCGDAGAGRAATMRDPRVVVIGTLSKALGAAGGFVAGPAAVIDLVTNRARTFVFDTALPPPIAAAALRALGIIRSAEGDGLRLRLRASAARVRDDVRGLGYDVRGDEGHIIPVVLGSEGAALTLAAALHERGVYAPAIRPPTVPAGTSRLRISLRADHTDDDLDRLLFALRDAALVGTA